MYNVSVSQEGDVADHRCWWWLISNGRRCGGLLVADVVAHCWGRGGSLVGISMVAHWWAYGSALVESCCDSLIAHMWRYTVHTVCVGSMMGDVLAHWRGMYVLPHWEWYVNSLMGDIWLTKGGYELAHWQGYSGSTFGDLVAHWQGTCGI
jgi:hypothetical protein